jgi:hypothetical protein
MSQASALLVAVRRVDALCEGVCSHEFTNTNQLPASSGLRVHVALLGSLPVCGNLGSARMFEERTRRS